MTAKDLKNSILQLAVQGRLVPQNPDDEPASELLKRIRATRHQLQKNKLAKKSLATEDIYESEIPFDLPDNWTWAKLGWIAQKVGAGSTPQGGAAVYVHNGIKFLREQNVHDAGLHLSNVVFIDEKTHHQMAGSIVRPQDILMNITGASIGRNALVADDFDEANVNQHVLIIRLVDKALRHYLHYCFCAPFVLNQMFSKQIGDKPGLSAKKVENFLIPLPPLAEQKCIVSKIEELMPLVEEYGKAEERLSALNAELPDVLRKSILQQAIQGKLTRRAPADEPASELLKRIRAEKTSLLISGKIRKEKPLPPITKGELPFEIPEGWEWVRLGDIGLWGAGATPSKSNAAYYANGTIPWLVTGDLNDGIITDIPGKITPLALEKTSVKLNPPNSVLIAMYGATIGKTGLLSFPATTNQACCACQVFGKINTWYLMYFLMSQRKEFLKRGEGGAQPNISKEKIVITLFPLPPLAEQARIVSRVDELLGMCDDLKAVSNRTEP